MSPHPDQTRRALLDLSRDLGAEQRRLAILGEGNTSTRATDETFFVKASGCSLGSLKDDDLVECRLEPLLALLDRDDAEAAEVDAILLSSRGDSSAKKPSVEALFHAYLLSLPGIRFVGHTHPIAVNALLCSPRAQEYAHGRIFPDEIVCCGRRSVFVPYTDPGLRLAQAIRRETTPFLEQYGLPRVILLQSHGLITLGASPEAVKASMAMAVKAAEIFAGAARLGGPLFLTE